MGNGVNPNLKDNQVLKNLLLAATVLNGQVNNGLAVTFTSTYGPHVDALSISLDAAAIGWATSGMKEVAATAFFARDGGLVTHGAMTVKLDVVGTDKAPGAEKVRVMAVIKPLTFTQPRSGFSYPSDYNGEPNEADLASQIVFAPDALSCDVFPFDGTNVIYTSLDLADRLVAIVVDESEAETLVQTMQTNIANAQSGLAAAQQAAADAAAQVTVVQAQLSNATQSAEVARLALTFLNRLAVVH